MDSTISPLGIFHLAIAFIVIISMVVTMFRLAKGPAILDRSIALDVLVSGAIALTAVVTVSLKREDLGVLLVIFALTSFISGVVIARFARKTDSLHKPVLSEEEARQQVAEREREAEDAELTELTDAQIQAAEQQTPRDGVPQVLGHADGASVNIERARGDHIDHAVHDARSDQDQLMSPGEERS